MTKLYKICQNFKKTSSFYRKIVNLNRKLSNFGNKYQIQQKIIEKMPKFFTVNYYRYIEKKFLHIQTKCEIQKQNVIFEITTQYFTSTFLDSVVFLILQIFTNQRH